MVKNLWKQIEVVCGCHAEPVPMYAKSGHRSMFYACPKYYPDARGTGEIACKNNISTEDFEKVLDKLSDTIEQLMMTGQTISLTHMKFKVKSIYIEVIRHVDDKIVLSIVNKKALDS